MRTQAITQSRRRRPSLFDQAWRRFHNDERGFSIIEVVVAMALFAIVATFMSQTLAGGMKGVLGAKRREVATHEGTRTIEIARSLSYNAIGLDVTDPADATIATDPAIQDQAGVKKYLVGTEWEPIIDSTGADNPFNPHILEVTRGSTKLTRYVYVTGVDSDADGTQDLKRVTVRVSWDSAGSAGPKNEIRAQTLINPEGIVTTGDITPLKTDSFVSGGTVTVKSDTGVLTGLVPAVLPETPESITLPNSTGASTYRAVSTTSCTTRSTALSGAGTTIYGGEPVSVTADDDAQTTAETNPAPQTYSSIPPVTVGGVDAISDLLLQATVSSPVSCQATAEDNDGATPTDDGYPYEAGSASSPGTLELVQSLTGLGLALPSTSLTAVSVAPQPISQSIDDQLVSGSRETLASAQGSIGTVNILKLPGVFADGLVRVDGLTYGVAVRGAAGTPSAAPTVTSPTINMRIYDVDSQIPNGSCASRTGGYCVISVNPAAVGFTGAAFDVSTSVNVGLTQLIYEIHVNLHPPAKDTVDGVVGPNGEKRWSAEYTPISVSARLRASLTVPLVGSAVLSDTTADVTLGSAKAEACAGVTC